RMREGRRCASRQFIERLDSMWMKMSGSAPFFNTRHNQRLNGWQSHGCVWTRNMQVQTKFLWLRKPVAIGGQVDGWRVCWIGGWDRCRVFFVVMRVREYAGRRRA